MDCSSLGNLQVKRQVQLIDCQKTVFAIEFNQNIGLECFILPFEFHLFSEVAKLCLQERDSKRVVIAIPQGVNVRSGQLSLINQFMEMHDFSTKRIKLGKVYQNNYEDAFDKVTYNFVKNRISILEQHTVRTLMNTCEYLKIGQVKRVLCIYIASLYHSNYNEIVMKIRIKHFKVDDTWEHDWTLKKDFKSYFQQLGEDVLEMVRRKDYIMEIKEADLN